MTGIEKEKKFCAGEASYFGGVGGVRLTASTTVPAGRVRWAVVPSFLRRSSAAKAFARMQIW